jgi:hypothetical protein
MSSSKRRLRRARDRAVAIAACSTQRASDQIVAEAGPAALPAPDSALRRTILFGMPIRRLERLTGLSRVELRFLSDLPDEDFDRIILVGAGPFLRELAAHRVPAQAAE